MIRAADFASLSLAVAAANAAGDALELTGGVVYDVAEELRLGHGDGRRCILHGNGAVIRATEPMHSVLAVYRNAAIVRDLNIEAGRLATHGVYTDTSSASTYEHVDALQALSDGFHVSHDNDRSRFLACSARLCGTIWHTAGYAGPSPANIRTAVTGTCTVGSGSAYGRVVTFAGLSTPLTSMGLRRGDWISVDPTAPGHTGAMFWAPILSVDSPAQLTLDFHSYFPGYTDPLRFSIHRGDGWHFGPGRADNNIHYLESCLAENVACNGFYLGGLYGQRCHNLQVNAAGAHPLVIGGAAQDRHVLGTLVHGFYTENGLNGASNHILCEGAIGVDISTCSASGDVGVTNPSTNVGAVRNDQYLTDVTRFEVPIGAAQTRLDGSPQLSARCGSAVLSLNERSLTVPFIGMQPSGKVFVTPRAPVPVALEAQASVGEFSIQTQHRVTQPVIVDYFVASLS